MARRLFGTDGIRGVANREPMTAETALKLGHAIAHLAWEGSGNRPRILVGKDTRASGDLLECALAAGVLSRGADAVLAGVMPTPAIAFLTTEMRCDAAAVISASHNPFEDNGIKFFSKAGFKLSDGEEERIEALIFSHTVDETDRTGEKIGRALRVEDDLCRYVAFLKNTLPGKMDFRGMKVVLDCANGAAYRAAPLVLSELGAGVATHGADPDGTNINRHCGSLHPELIAREVVHTGAHLGIALDGDADRAILCDELGNEVDGDQIMGLVAWDMMREGKLSGNTVVATVMSNMGLEVALRELGVSLVRTPVGDRYVVERMRLDGYNFGGEQSGHLIFLDHNTSGDGILSALQVMRIMAETGKPLSELASRVKRFPQFMKNVSVRERRELHEVPEVSRIMRECSERLGTSGRLLVRYSGTQLLCRVMAEGEDEDQVRSTVDMVSDAISRHL